MPAGSAKTKKPEGGGAVAETTKNSNSAEANEQAFWDAMEKRGKGDAIFRFAKIADVRRDLRELGWSDGQVDNMLGNLRDRGLLQLQDGDTDYFTKQDIKDSFVDENGFRFLNMMRLPRR